MSYTFLRPEVGDLWKLRGNKFPTHTIPDQYFLVLEVYRSEEDNLYLGTRSMKVDCGTICDVMVNGDITIWSKEA